MHATNFTVKSTLGQIHKRKNFVERLDLNDVMSWYHTLLIWKEMTIGLPIGLRSKVLSRQKIAVSCTISFPTFTLLHHLLKKRESSCIWNEAIFFLMIIICSIILSFIYSFTYPIYSFIHSFIYWFIFLSYFPPSNSLLFLFPSIHSFIFIYSSIHSFIQSFIQSFIHSFIHSLLHRVNSRKSVTWSAVPYAPLLVSLMLAI